MFYEMPEKYGIMGALYKAYLGPQIFEFVRPYVGKDEIWELPEFFKVFLEMDNVSTPDFAIGKVWFGEYDGVKCIAECNASPIIFYRGRISG